MGAVVVDSGGALTLVFETTCVIGFVATVDMFETVEFEVEVGAPSEVSFSTSIDDDVATGFMVLPIAGVGAEIVVASVVGAEDDMVQENDNFAWRRSHCVVIKWL